MTSFRVRYRLLRSVLFFLALLQVATSTHSQDLRDQFAQSFGELFALGTPRSISDLVIREFVGTWYEDNDEAYRMLVRAHERAPAESRGPLTRPESQLGLKPGKPFVTVYANRTFKTHTSFSEDPPRLLRVNGLRIELPSVGNPDPNAFAAVYRFGRRYYLASRESGLIPLMRK